MLNITEIDDKLVIRFHYDMEVVKEIKGITGRVWNATDKAWYIPKSSIEELIKTFGLDMLNIDESINVDQLIADAKNGEVNKPKTDVFNSVLETIENSYMRAFAEWGLSVLPTYFYEVAASSTGKYHPSYTLGYGGLVRHTKAAIIFANELFGNHTIQNFSDMERDCIRIALLLHDGTKHGLNGSAFVTSEHPLKVIEYITNKYNENQDNISTEIKIVMKNYWTTISNCIASHMGEWNTDYRSKKEILPKPQTEMEKFTHLCDYLAARKVVEVIM